MTIQEAKQRQAELENRFEQERKALYQQVLLERQSADGDRMRRIRYNPDDTPFEVIAVIVGAIANTCAFEMTDYGPRGGYPSVYYSLRVESPDDYNSRQSAEYLGIPPGRYEDFWQGDPEWTLIE